MLEDYALIEASFLEQYNIRLSEVNMSWREFNDLLSCISAYTPLGRIVTIRSENDPETLKNFNEAQREIRKEWMNQHCKAKSDEAYAQSMKGLLSMALA